MVPASPLWRTTALSLPGKAVLATQLQSLSIQRHGCRLPGLVECFAHEVLAMLLMVMLLMVLRPQKRLRPTRLG